MKPLASLRLYLLFSPELCAGPPERTLADAIAGGVDVVQWRQKGAVDRGALARARQVCLAAGVPLVVNDDPALAAELDADGVHIGQEDGIPAAARAAIGDRWLGISTHDLQQIAQAEADGADYLGFGPAFATATKGYAQGLGVAVVARACAATRLPVFAIGGIDTANVAELVAAGCRRIAVCRAILAAADPRAAAAELAGIVKD